ncbi:MAG: flagellar hook-basal body complex protein [Planctomycetota bacterium]
MGLQSALTTSLTGLQAAETTIDVVGNNVANSNTVGFKESNTIFATQFLQTISIGSAPSTNSGGTNPRQVGLGVKVSQIAPDFSQGTIEISSNPLDVAIQGDGFLVVQDATTRLYTRNGQLQLNSANEVVTSTGQRVLGYGVDDDFDLLTNTLTPLTIDLGAERVAQATSTVNFTGVLNPEVDPGSTPSISTSVVLGTNEYPQPPIATGATFDGADLAEAAAPVTTGAAAASADGTTTGPGAGTVNYRVTLLDNNGNESVPSAQFSVTGDGTAVDLSSIPTGSGAFQSGRRIYRTEPGGTNFYLAAQINDNTTTTLSDSVDDATLVTNTQLDSSIIEPGSYSYYVTFYNSNDLIETRPTAQIGSQALSTPGGRIRLNLDDLEAPAGFDQLRIYRSVNGNTGQFRRIDTDANPISSSATSYVDSTSDATLVSENRAQVNLDGPPASLATRLVDLVTRSGDTYVENFFQQGTLTFTGEKDGVALPPKSLAITGDPDNPQSTDTTVSELLAFMEEALGIDSEITGTSDGDQPASGVTIDSNGQIVITSNLGEENAINVPLTAFQLQPADSTSTNTLGITFTETQPADGPGTTTEITVYDSLGLPLSVRITTVLEQPDDPTGTSTFYRWFATSGDNQPINGSSTVVGDGLLQFDSNGDLVNVNQDRIAIFRNDTASESPLEVQLDFGLIKSLGETDAQGEATSSLNFASQDGFPPGVLTDFIITDDGLVQGQFSNGTQRTVGQIVMARFANNSGLQQVGDSLFNIGVNSGEPILGEPGEDGIGTLTAGAVELSNTDIGQNLIELILASTQYRGGARVITTTQELLDELLALQR